jgi:hypothetical protein
MYAGDPFVSMMLVTAQGESVAVCKDGLMRCEYTADGLVAKTFYPWPWTVRPSDHPGEEPAAVALGGEG